VIVVSEAWRMSRFKGPNGSSPKGRELILVFVVVVVREELTVPIHSAGRKNVIYTSIVHLVSRNLHAITIALGRALWVEPIAVVIGIRSVYV
jgi:hypothetical protein